jgi:hypothetical protein
MWGVTHPRTSPSERPAFTDPVRSRQVARSIALDVACVLVFVAIGRRSHGEAGVLAGIGATAAPFLSGLIAGWLVLALVRDEPASLRAGGVLVVATVVVGMVVRHTVGGGTPPSFVAVATIVLTVFLVGWRLVATRLARRS